MLFYAGGSAATAAAAAARASAVGVHSLAIVGSQSHVKGMVQTWEAVLWRCLDLLLVAAAGNNSSPRRNRRDDNNKDDDDKFCRGEEEGTGNEKRARSPPASPLTTRHTLHLEPPLRILDINFDAHMFLYRSIDPRSFANVPIIRTLCTVPAYAALTRRLEVLRITWNRHDDAADLLFLSQCLHGEKNKDDDDTSSKLTAAAAAAESPIIKQPQQQQLKKQQQQQRPHSPSSNSSCTAAGYSSSHCSSVPFQWLRELTLRCCGLTSLRALGEEWWVGEEENDDEEEQSCFVHPVSRKNRHNRRQLMPKLEKLDVTFCEALASLDGIQGLERLQELTAVRTRITDLQPLLHVAVESSSSSVHNHPSSSTSPPPLPPSASTVIFLSSKKKKSLSPPPPPPPQPELPTPTNSCFCPLLRKVNVSQNRTLTSLRGLEDHKWLEEVDASQTFITSLTPLSSLTTRGGGCCRLRVLAINQCFALKSLEGMNEQLVILEASHAGISSLLPLRQCPRLVRVSVASCQSLQSLEGLGGPVYHTDLSYVDASRTNITSVEALAGSPALRVLDLRGCRTWLENDANVESNCAKLLPDTEIYIY